MIFSMKKIGLFFMLTAFSVCQESELYTSQQAYDCFTQKALPKCSQIIQKCVLDEQCGNQLGLHQDCSFGSGEAQQIYNGYCFKKWKQQATLTAPTVQCIIQQCNLLYNSNIGYKELFQCSQQVIMGVLDDQNMPDCEEQCLTALNDIQLQFHAKTASNLFSTEIKNEAAGIILQKIKENCIDKPYEPSKSAEDQLQQQLGTQL